MSYRGLVLILLLVSYLPATAEVSTNPDPTRLKSDWWSYFSPEAPLSDEELGKRISATETMLKQLEKTLDNKARVEVLPAIIQLRELLAAYHSRRNEQPVAVKPLALSQDSYTLAEVFSLENSLLNLSSEIEYESADIEWQRDLISAERKQQSQRKVAYLEDSKMSADRLAIGVVLMSTRLKLELDLHDLNNRQKRLDRLIVQKTELQKEIKDIALRLVFKTEDLDFWKSKHKRALEDANRIINEDMHKKPRPLTSEGDLVTQSRRADSLAIAHRELLITAQELLALRAELLIGLIQLSSSENRQTETLKVTLTTAEEQINNLQPKQKYWKSSVTGLKTVRVDKAETKAEMAASEKILRATDELATAVNKAITDVDHELDLLKFSIALTKRWMRLGETGLQSGWSLTTAFVSDTFGNMKSVFVTSLFEVNETPVTLLGLFRVMIIVFIAWVISRGARGAIKHLSERSSSVNQSSIYALSRVIHYVLLSLGVVIGLSSIGVDFTKFALLASALSIGIGFGLQTLVSNFVAGLIILFEKSMKVGDFVELESGVTGEVLEINMRSTLVTTNDNIDILVPNSEFVSKSVINWTMRDAYRRLRVPFGVAYGSDKELVKKAVLEAAANVKWTLNTTSKVREPQVWLVNFGDSSLDFELVVWIIPEAVKRPSGVQASYLWEIESKLAEYKIEIPFPQRDLHLRSGFNAPPVQL